MRSNPWRRKSSREHSRRAPPRRVVVTIVRRRPFWISFAVGVAALLLSWSSGVADERPNVLFVLIDDLGYGDLSCTGNRHVVTENVDRMAREGTRFTQFYVASPICSPSRVAFTTGRYPARHGIHSYLASRRQNERRGMVHWLDPSAPSVARAFQNAGYATAHFGKWHMGGGRDVGDAPLPQAYGFEASLVSFEGLGDRILPPGGLSDQSARLGRGEIRRVEKHEQTGIYVDRAIDFIDRTRDQPFYIHLWLNDVHDAHVPAAEDLARYEHLADDPYHQRFCAVLERMDRELGRLFDHIDSAGLAEKTLILITSDNGPTAWPRYYREGFDPPGSTAGFRGRKWSLYEGGIRMPLIIRRPGHVPAARVDDVTVMAAVDYLPTVCALAGVEPPAAELDGEDMSAAFRGTAVSRAGPIFWEYGRDESYLQPGAEQDRSPGLAVRDGRWKLLMNADGAQVELYDFDAETAESLNVAERHPDVAERLAAELLSWWEDVQHTAAPVR